MSGRQSGFHAANFQPTAQLAGELQHEDTVRNELFSGAGQTSAGGVGHGGQQTEEPTIDQLVRKAEDTHKDTTNTAQRALRVLEQTRQVQAETMAELEEQSKQMNNMNARLNQVNQDLTYSEKLLRYMRRCCCCIIFDCCTGADPEGQRARQWEKQVDKGKTAKYDNAKNVVAGPRPAGTGAVASNGKAGAAAAAANKGSAYRDPDIRLTDEHRDKELQLQQETRKQNEILDQIHNGLGDLLQGARAMNSELTVQNQGADQLQERFEKTNYRLQQVNDKSQLRKFR